HCPPLPNGRRQAAGPTRWNPPPGQRQATRTECAVLAWLAPYVVPGATNVEAWLNQALSDKSHGPCRTRRSASIDFGAGSLHNFFIFGELGLHEGGEFVR